VGDRERPPIATLAMVFRPTPKNFSSVQLSRTRAMRWLEETKASAMQIAACVIEELGKNEGMPWSDGDNNTNITKHHQSVNFFCTSLPLFDVINRLRHMKHIQ